ncbi:MAG: cytochrome c [bacterium]|jgi:hypothetical protein|nr:MAG: cytochrome c [bacterium]KAF0147441.1 MAG: cytochrome c [bacterium]KAF0166299.1 MAG: cytochrome c [bacterium]TXT16451.1 MAG: cytochrome c [bacterium]
MFIRFLRGLALAAGLTAGTAAAAEPPILTVTTEGRDINQTLAALHRAAAGHNYSYVRQQAIDSRLVPYGQEVRSVRLFYFCNMEKMDRALRLDPRSAQWIPYRITLVETATGVDLMAVNPAWVALGIGNPALWPEAEALKRDFLSILDEVTL